MTFSYWWRGDLGQKINDPDTLEVSLVVKEVPDCRTLYKNGDWQVKTFLNLESCLRETEEELEHCAQFKQFLYGHKLATIRCLLIEEIEKKLKEVEQ